jgi:uncharacterized membrane protein required for colicin V production
MDTRARRHRRQRECEGVDVIGQLTWFDMVIILLLVGGVFAGFTQGMIRYVLNCVAVVIAFVLAAQLKGPIIDLLGFWRAFTPEGRELLIFVLLYVGFVITGFVVVRALYHRTRLPIVRQLDEIGGAIFGLVFVAMVITFLVVVYDSYYLAGGDAVGWVSSLYEALTGSLLVQFFRDTLIPTAGFLARPFVPGEIADLLRP